MRRSLIVGLLASLLIGCGLLGPSAEKPRNVVLVCIDTVRYDAFWLTERLGSDDLFSPWADRAIRFRKAHSVSPWTVPTIASVMTGLLPESHGAGLFPGEVANLSSELPSPLRRDVPTLAEILTANGYRTSVITSHPWIVMPEYGLSRGFEKTLTPYDEEILEEAFRWLLAHPSEQPFFLNLHLMAAHEWHRQPRAVLRHRIESIPAEKLEQWKASAPFPFPEKLERRELRFLAYMQAVEALRGRLAKLLATLEEAGILSHTAVVVYSDHGEEFDDHPGAEHPEFIDPRGIHGAGHGHTLYQELLHVPLLAWVPEVPGTDLEFPTSLVDIAPTLLSWSGIDVALERTDGLDLSALAAGLETTEESRERPLFASSIAYGPARSMVLAGRWKLIRSDYDRKSSLFDLQSDPRETSPKNDEQPEVAERLHRLLDERVSASPPSAAPAITPEQLERLRGLGYIKSPP